MSHYEFFKVQIIQNKYLNDYNTKYNKDINVIYNLVLINAKFNKLIGYSEHEIIEKIIFESYIFSLDKQNIINILESTVYINNLSNEEINIYVISLIKKAEKYREKYYLYNTGFFKTISDNNINKKSIGEQCVSDKFCKIGRAHV